MIKHDIKPRYIPVSEIAVDMNRNVREQTESAYDIEPLINDIRARGQQDPVTVEKIGEVYYPIKGFRRSAAIKTAWERGLKFEDTAPEAGKPMEKILVIVYEGLDERERTELLLDHGQRKGLNRVELQNAFERAFVAGYTDKEIVTLLFGLLVSLYAPTRKVDEDSTGAKLVGEKLAQARFEYYKGILQTAKRAYHAPTVLRDAFYKKLRGEQNWPTNSELVDLKSIHDKEVSENPLLSQKNPGPKFLEKWNALVAAKAETSGDTRPKATAMRNRQQNEDSLKTLECPLVKAMVMIQLGDIPVDRLPVLDRIMMKFWNGEQLQESDKAEVVSWFKKPEAAPEAK